MQYYKWLSSSFFFDPNIFIRTLRSGLEISAALLRSQLRSNTGKNYQNLSTYLCVNTPCVRIHGCSLIYTYGLCSIRVCSLDYSANWWEHFMTKELETIKKEVFFFTLSELPTFSSSG